MKCVTETQNGKINFSFLRIGTTLLKKWHVTWDLKNGQKFQGMWPGGQDWEGGFPLEISQLS